MKILEVFDYGYSLVETAMGERLVLSPQGNLMSVDEYKAMQQIKARNKLDWQEIPTDEFTDIVKNSIFAVKTKEDGNGNVNIACLDNEGQAYFLQRSVSFGEASIERFAECDYQRILKSVDYHRPDVTDKYVAIIEELFDTTEQLGQEFEIDGEAMMIKKGIKDGNLWQLTWRKGELISIKDKGAVKASAIVNVDIQDPLANLDNLL